jgi:DNA-binding transcriptional LysR family regulator
VAAPTTIDFGHAMCKNAEVALPALDWDDLRYVLALFRDRSSSRAGERLGVSHTTVGRRLRAIEEALGVRLFDQTPQGFVPTPAGRDVAEVAERMETELMSLEGRVLGADAKLEGKLRVATTDLLFRRYQSAFSSFLARYPSVELTVIASDTQVSFTRREADVALRMTNTPPEYLVGRKVGRVHFAVYGSKELVQRMGPKATLDDYPWLAWDEQRPDMRWLDAWLAVNAPKARIAMRVDFSFLALRETICKGIGVHFLACFEGDAEPGLERIGSVDPGHSRDLWLLTLPELRSTSRIRAFIDHMDEQIRTS